MSWKNDFQGLIDQARAADKALWAAAKAAQEDRFLSEEGKRAKIAEAEGAYNAQVSQLKAQGRPLLERAAAANSEALRKAQGAELRTLRETLGDALVVDIIKTRLTLLKPQEAVKWANDALTWGDPWASRLLTELTDLELSRRAADGDPRADAARAGLPSTTDAATVELETEARELRNSQGLLDQLDARHYREVTAAKLGVHSDFMQ